MRMTCVFAIAFVHDSEGFSIAMLFAGRSYLFDRNDENIGFIKIDWPGNRFL